ncbi:hypothetical protein G6F35_017556 [Rhizopus arrhizus]|nr:hypothetical protein G6F35_017556 [Rhizopus arrhizus]KAG1378249.1 hypothetical protein G6F60_015296 [Rhizopus arrhizus]
MTVWNGTMPSQPTVCPSTCTAGAVHRTGPAATERRSGRTAVAPALHAHAPGPGAASAPSDRCHRAGGPSRRARGIRAAGAASGAACAGRPDR